MPQITLLQLRKLGACADQCAEFKKRFGKSVEITEELCLSVAGVFSWDWAANNLLGAPALAEYGRVTVPAWAEYDRVIAAAWAEYKRVEAQAFARLFHGCN